MIVDIIRVLILAVECTVCSIFTLAKLISVSIIVVTFARYVVVS